MHRRNGLDRLDLHDYFVFHNQVRPESRLDPRALINYGNNLLPDRAQASLFQLVFVHVQLKTISRKAAKIAKKTSHGCQIMPAGPLGRSALRESLGVLPFAVSYRWRAETRSARGERHAIFYEQISRPDSGNAE